MPGGGATQSKAYNQTANRKTPVWKSLFCSP